MINSDEGKELEGRIAQLNEQTERRFDKGDEKFDKIIAAIGENADCINRLTEDVQPILELQRDIMGVGRVSKRVQKFGLYLASIPVIGAGLFQIYAFLIEYFKGPLQ